MPTNEFDDPNLYDEKSFLLAIAQIEMVGVLKPSYILFSPDDYAQPTEQVIETKLAELSKISGCRSVEIFELAKVGHWHK